MSIPTLAEKLKALKVTEASAYERACADKVTRGAYEIKLQAASGSVPAHGHVH